MNASDNFKWTPLHFAAHAGLHDAVEFLLNNGADLEAHTMNLATPLMRAIESSKPEVVQYLIDKGAKVQIENKKGKWRNWNTHVVYLCIPCSQVLSKK